MKWTWLCATVLVGFVTLARADSNLRIEDVGLHGYVGAPSPVTVVLRNPSPQPQRIHLEISDEGPEPSRYFPSNTVTSDVLLNGGEQRRLEIPVLLNATKVRVVASATVGGAVIGLDKYEGVLKREKLIAILCVGDEICKTAQSQMQFSGSAEARDSKNQQLVFRAMRDARDDWWAYTAANALVVAMPLSQLTAAQRDALEGYLRSGGRLILLEDEIADAAFLSAYRQSRAPNGERVGKGTLFLIAGLKANTLGDLFSGKSLQTMLQEQYAGMWDGGAPDAPDALGRFVTSFSFPRLRWLLAWLAAYIVVIGVINFAVLRRLKRVDYGWISTCILALLFAAGFYFSSSSNRPREFRLDNLDSYYLDSRSPLAAADYRLRVSAPERREVTVSIADPAVFEFTTSRRGQANSQIWTEMNGDGPSGDIDYDVSLGPPRETDLSLLKWSFRDLKLRGLRQFPGTVHFIAPNRLRNDTGQNFDDAIYIDHDANSIYTLPGLAAGQEIQLDSLTPQPFDLNKAPGYTKVLVAGQQSLEMLARRNLLPYAGQRYVFAGIGEGPALPANLNLPHQQNVHTLILVNLEQP